VDRDFDQSILDHRSHRPWPMPQAPWVMTQTWHDLLFAHWPVAPRVLEGSVPPHFPIDVFDGAAWIGVVPFHMTNVAPRGVPAVPRLSAFPELNVRTYVRVGDRPGVYFFSLDAGSAVAVRAARMLLNLPYYAASMTVMSTAAGIEYHSRREGSGPATFAATYGPAGAPFFARAGSLEYFLTERYCLYNLDRRGKPYRLEIHHPPWPLQPARAGMLRHTMDAVNGLSLSPEPALLHFAKRQDMVAWLPARLP
jgi:uncharacterized protein